MGGLFICLIISTGQERYRLKMVQDSAERCVCVCACVITQLSQRSHQAFLGKQHQRGSLCSKFRSLVDINSHACVNKGTG